MADPRAHERAALGARCRELMQSETFQVAISAVDQDFQRQIMSTRPDQTEKREQLFLEYHALKRIIGKLRNYEADGEMAQVEIDRENNN